MEKIVIKSIEAREILDSRGNPTVEVELETSQGIFLASVPSGASKGKYEALELRDGGKRYYGKGVLKAVNNINRIIAPKVLGLEVKKQKEIDDLMVKLDGTSNKSKLGANAILAVSMALCRAGAQASNLPLYRYIGKLAKNNRKKLPQPAFNVINGGQHAGSDLDFQEFMIVPQDKNFKKSLQVASEIYHELKKIIKEKYGNLAVNVGDEGGFAPPLKEPEQALDLIMEAAKNLSYSSKVKIIIDVASSGFFDKNNYKLRTGFLNSHNLATYYLNLIKKYPIIGIEDGFAEDDIKGWKNFTARIMVIGDDLLATNPERIKMAKKEKLCNSAIVKINQIGTVSEAIEAANLAKRYHWKTIVSHRSGDTCDDFIADFSVGVGADFIKSGAPCRGERLAKYNRLLRI